MAMSIDAALKMLREAGVAFTANGGDWILQNLNLSSEELVQLCRLLKER